MPQRRELLGQPVQADLGRRRVGRAAQCAGLGAHQVEVVVAVVGAEGTGRGRRTGGLERRDAVVVVAGGQCRGDHLREVPDLHGPRADREPQAGADEQEDEETAVEEVVDGGQQVVQGLEHERLPTVGTRRLRHRGVVRGTRRDVARSPVAGLGARLADGSHIDPATTHRRPVTSTGPTGGTHRGARRRVTPRRGADQRGLCASSEPARAGSLACHTVVAVPAGSPDAATASSTVNRGRSIPAARWRS